MVTKALEELKAQTRNGKANQRLAANQKLTPP